MLTADDDDRAASKDEIRQSGVTVASLFLGKVFGSQAQKALTVFIALRFVKGICDRACSSLILFG